MAKGTCSIEGCERPTVAGGLCGKHYQRKRMHDPTKVWPTCSVDGCTKRAKACGWCDMHYWRWNTYKSMAAPTRRPRNRGGTPVQRFEAHINRDGPIKYAHLGPCWESTYRPGSNGYTSISVDRVPIPCHRFAWILAYGEPPPDKPFVCHHCDNPLCVRLEHLFVGTHVDNMRDELAKGRNHNAAKTHCKYGHEFDEANTHRAKQGGRVCRICLAAKGRQMRQRVSAARREGRDNGNYGLATGARTHCPKGHPYDEANTYITPSNGGRLCRACSADRDKRRQAAKKASRTA